MSEIRCFDLFNIHDPIKRSPVSNLRVFPLCCSALRRLRGGAVCGEETRFLTFGLPVQTPSSSRLLCPNRLLLSLLAQHTHFSPLPLLYSILFYIYFCSPAPPPRLFHLSAQDASCERCVPSPNPSVPLMGATSGSRATFPASPLGASLHP